MKIITISGVDGSGKSTQVQLLKKHLESQGKKVYYFHAVNFSLAKKIANLKRYCLLCRMFGKCKVDNGQEEKSVTKANKLQIILRALFLCLDSSRFKKLLKKLEKENFDYLVSDRYFFDTVVNIEYLSSKTNWNLDDGLIKPDLAMFLEVSPETIMTRDRVPDQGLSYLQKKTELFKSKLEKWNMKVVDGGGNKEEVFERVKSLISNYQFPMSNQ